MSLRPLVARANVSGSNPFSSFGKGLGQGVKSKLVVRGAFWGKWGQPRSIHPVLPPGGSTASTESTPLSHLYLQTSVFFTGPDDVAVKKTGPRIRYGKDFLMQFMTVREAVENIPWTRLVLILDSACAS